jgi:hypothetical protein
LLFVPLVLWEWGCRKSLPVTESAGLNLDGFELGRDALVGVIFILAFVATKECIALIATANYFLN